MSDLSYSERDSKVRADMNDENKSTPEVSAEDIYEDGIDGLDTSRSRNGGRIILPNERLAVFWKKVFAVQFTDGGWQATNKSESSGRNRRHYGRHQMEHPFEYSNAEVVVDTTRTTPKFECSTTHEKMCPPEDHFDPVPHLMDDMVYLARMLTGDDSYDMADLRADLQLFEDMEFRIAAVENCSKCNSEIY